MGFGSIMEQVLTLFAAQFPTLKEFDARNGFMRELYQCRSLKKIVLALIAHIS